MVVPQAPQNFLPAGTRLPHFGFGHIIADAAGAPPVDAPHPAQNLAPDFSLTPHCPHNDAANATGGGAAGCAVDGRIVTDREVRAGGAGSHDEQ